MCSKCTAVICSVVILHLFVKSFNASTFNSRFNAFTAVTNAVDRSYRYSSCGYSCSYCYIYGYRYIPWYVLIGPVTRTNLVSANHSFGHRYSYGYSSHSSYGHIYDYVYICTYSYSETQQGVCDVHTNYIMAG